MRQVRQGHLRQHKSSLRSSSVRASSESHHSYTNTDTETDTSSVRFMVRDGEPGLFLATPKVRKWTPIAARTRTQTHTSNKI